MATDRVSLPDNEISISVYGIVRGRGCSGTSPSAYDHRSSLGGGARDRSHSGSGNRKRGSADLLIDALTNIPDSTLQIVVL